MWEGFASRLIETRGQLFVDWHLAGFQADETGLFLAMINIKICYTSRKEVLFHICRNYWKCWLILLHWKLPVFQLNLPSKKGIPPFFFGPPSMTAFWNTLCSVNGQSHDQQCHSQLFQGYGPKGLKTILLIWWVCQCYSEGCLGWRGGITIFN